jgi:hypothetical protein
MPDRDESGDSLDSNGDGDEPQVESPSGIFGGPGVEEVIKRTGWLTDTDREVLLDEGDFEPGTDRRRQARRRLRQRLVGGFLDMILIERHLEARDRELVLDRFDADRLLAPEGERVETDLDVLDHLEAFDHLFAFLWRGLKGRMPTFRDHLEGGVIRGEHDPSPGPAQYDDYRVAVVVEEVLPPETPINYASLTSFLRTRGRTGQLEGETLVELIDAIHTYDPGPEELVDAIEQLTEHDSDRD